MANGKTDDEERKEIAKEVRADVKAKVELEAKDKALNESNRAKRYYKTAMEQATAGLNTTQVVIGGIGVVGGTFAGYWLNQFLRKKTAEWEWVNDEGERSIGSILLADIALPVIGTLFAGASGYLFRKRGGIAAGLVGFFLGFAGGSVLSSALGPD